MFNRFLLIVLLVFTLNVFSDVIEGEYESFQADIVSAAIERTQHSIRYDGRYLSNPYPNGDVRVDMGVCTDVVIKNLSRNRL